MAIIISDIHGDIAKAKAFLSYKPDVKHVCLGDLMDSRDTNISLQADLDCLRFILGSDCVLLWGNHDLAHTDKPCWETFAQPKDTYGPVSSLIRPHQDRFKAAHAVDGWLCTHSGVSKALAHMLPDMPLESGDPAKVAGWINEQFQHNRQIRREGIGGSQYYGVGPLFARHGSRGGDDQYGGIFWYDHQRELSTPDPRVKQLFGRTPIAGPLKRSEWNNINIECGCWVFDTEVNDFAILE